MKTLIQEQRRYHYGIPDDAIPPHNCILGLSASGRLLVLIDYHGREFYACPVDGGWNLTPLCRATLWDKIRTFGRFRLGQEYADTRTLIRLEA